MSEKPPCECIQKIDGRWTYRCECSNGGSAEYAASWVADENAQDEIARLTAEVAWHVKDKNKWEDTQAAHLRKVICLRAEVKRQYDQNTETIIRVAALEVENEKLRAALEPLACTCDRPNGAACSRSEVDCPFWNARAALEKKR